MYCKRNFIRHVNLELAWVWSKQAPTLFLTDLLKILNTPLDSVSKISTTAVTTATVSVKRTQYIHTEIINTKLDKIDLSVKHSAISAGKIFGQYIHTTELLQYCKTLTYQKILDQTNNPKCLTQFPLYRLKQN